MLTPAQNDYLEYLGELFSLVKQVRAEKVDETKEKIYKYVVLNSEYLNLVNDICYFLTNKDKLQPNTEILKNRIYNEIESKELHKLSITNADGSKAYTDIVEYYI